MTNRWVQLLIKPSKTIRFGNYRRMKIAMVGLSRITNIKIIRRVFRLMLPKCALSKSSEVLNAVSQSRL